MTVAARAYYNEIDSYCVAWLRALIEAGHIPDGIVDARPIQEVQPEDLHEFTQCHFFAGLGGWAYAARLAGWPDDRPLWTGSCPCQPFSLAGKKLGKDDPRHVWPYFFPLIRTCRPPVVMGEQTAAKDGYVWLDGVGSDLESEDYAWRACDIPACSVNASQIRNRIYWVACSNRQGCAQFGERRIHDQGPSGNDVARRGTGIDWVACAARGQRKQRRGTVSHARDAERGISGSAGGGADDGGLGRPDEPRLSLPEREELRGARRRQEGRAVAEPSGAIGGLARSLQHGRGPGSTSQAGCESGRALTSDRGFWDDWQFIGPDPKGKYRRVKPGVRLLAHGIPGRVAKLRAFGNAIVPEEAAEVIVAWMETEIA
jgi:DNA (cytosine-5)-methyltransferase 1